MENNNIHKSLDRTPNTLGVILSGGASTRFNGNDKGLQIYQEKPLIQWVIDSFTQQVNEVVICINRNKNKYEEFSSPLVFDSDKTYQGPIAGIISAIEHCSTLDTHAQIEQLLISSCDTPLLPTDYLQKLNQALASNNYLVVVANDGTRNQNLHCLIKKEAWQSLIDFYENGGRAMHRWYKKIGVLEVDFSEQADCFLNINSADQLP